MHLLQAVLILNSTVLHYLKGTLITNFVYFEENLFQKYKSL